MDDLRVYTAGEIAELLRVSTSYVFNMLENRWLKAFKPEGEWRISRKALEEFIELMHSPSEYTDIFEAIKKGDTKAVKGFLAQGVDVNATDDLGSTSLHLASKYGHNEVVELLISKGAGINTKDKDGRTPLHLAGFQDHKAVVELLLSHGAEVNAIDYSGNAPLHLAQTSEIKGLLVEKGARDYE